MRLLTAFKAICSFRPTTDFGHSSLMSLFLKFTSGHARFPRALFHRVHYVCVRAKIVIKTKQSNLSADDSFQTEMNGNNFLLIKLIFNDKNVFSIKMVEFPRQLIQLFSLYNCFRPWNSTIL